ncbi:MAG: Ribosomal L1 domain-containing protein 1 [Marteilia pararefringens]
MASCAGDEILEKLQIKKAIEELLKCRDIKPGAEDNHIDFTLNVTMKIIPNQEIQTFVKLPHSFSTANTNNSLIIADRPIIRRKKVHKSTIRTEEVENIEFLNNEIRARDHEHITEVISFNTLKNYSLDLKKRNSLPKIVACESKIYPLVRRIINNKRSVIFAYRSTKKLDQRQVLNKVLIVSKRLSRTTSIRITSKGANFEVVFGNSRMSVDNLYNNCRSLISSLFQILPGGKLNMRVLTLVHGHQQKLPIYLNSKSLKQSDSMMTSSSRRTENYIGNIETLEPEESGLLIKKSKKLYVDELGQAHVVKDKLYSFDAAE